MLEDGTPGSGTLGGETFSLPGPRELEYRLGEPAGSWSSRPPASSWVAEVDVSGHVVSRWTVHPVRE